jgi:hypothetical protein
MEIFGRTERRRKCHRFITFGGLYSCNPFLFSMVTAQESSKWKSFLMYPSLLCPSCSVLEFVKDSTYR